MGVDLDASEYPLMAAVAERHWWYRSCRRLLRQLLRQELAAADPTDFVVLDAGCGVGATGGWLGDIGRVVALDASGDALDLYGESHPDGARIEGSVDAIALSDASVDLVVCVTVLYHESISDPGRAFDEFVRVLKPGGLLCSIEPGMRRMRRGHDEVTHGARRFDLEELRALAQQSGLTVERSTGAFSFLLPPAWIRSRRTRSSGSSDLSDNVSGLFGLLGAMASLERLLLGWISLPVGLSMVVLARKSGQDPDVGEIREATGGEPPVSVRRTGGGLWFRIRAGYAHRAPLAG